jgi:nucleoid-associated protein YgaU
MKNRFIVAVVALAAALAVGSYALWNNSQKVSKTPEVTSSTLDGEQAAPASTTPGTTGTTSTDTTTKPVGTETNKQGSSDAKTQGEKAVTVPETYTVAQGDFLRTIAEKFYGDAAYSADIERLNQLDNPDVLRPGQVLNMPRPDQLNTAASAPSPAKSDTKTDTKAETKADKDTNQ